MNIQIPKGTVLAVYTDVQTANGPQSIKIGRVNIWRRNFETSEDVASLDIELDCIPINGKLNIRQESIKKT